MRAQRELQTTLVCAKLVARGARIWRPSRPISNSAARNKIPLASATNQGFMFGNNKPNQTKAHAGHAANEEA